MSLPLARPAAEGMLTLAQAQGGVLGVSPRPAPAPPAPTFTTGGGMEDGYAALIGQYEAPFQQAAREVIDAGLAWMLDLSQPALVVLIAGCALLGAYGQFGIGSVLRYGFRVFLMLALLNGAYWEWIAEPALETIPNEIAHRVTGLGKSLRAVEQFDIVDNTITEIQTVAWGNASGMLQGFDRVAITFWGGLSRGILAVVFAVWLAMRILLHLVVMIGAFLIVLIPFESTKGFFRSFGAKVLSLSLWQIGAAITLKTLLNGIQLMLDRVTQIPMRSLSAQIALLQDLAIWNGIALFIFVCVPAAVAYGAAVSGVAAGAQAMIVRAGSSVGGAAVGVAGTVGAATYRAAGRLRRAG